MEEPITHDGSADLPNAADAETVLARTTGGAVADVEWCARRRLPPGDLDVVVYRGRVDHADHERYYVLLAPGAERGSGPSRVVPAASVDSPADLVSTFQADRRTEFGADAGAE